MVFLENYQLMRAAVAAARRSFSRHHEKGIHTRARVRRMAV